MRKGYGSEGNFGSGYVRNQARESKIGLLETLGKQHWKILNRGHDNWVNDQGEILTPKFVVIGLRSTKYGINGCIYECIYMVIVTTRIVRF